MIAIVTDSTAYLKQREAALWGVHVVPLSYRANGVLYTEGYLDRLGNYEKLIFGSDSLTSQASIGAFVSTFGELRRRGFEVLCLTLSSRLSGTFHTAFSAAREVDPDNIAVVDSHLTAGGLFLLIKQAKKCILSGMSLSQAALCIEEQRQDFGVVFSVEDMTALRKSGRLGPVRQSVSTILNLHPILLLEDGCVLSKGVVRGTHACRRALVDAIPENAVQVVVQELCAQEQARELAQMISKKLPGAQVSIRALGPVLGIHLGKGVLGAAWMKKDSAT